MTVGLARRLVWSGLATSEEVAAALHAHVKERHSFLKGLAAESPDRARELESELGRSLEEAAVVPDGELMARLPDGLCRALLAVPVGIDEQTGAVRVAVVDPLDAHAAAECAFHLDSPVQLVRASLRALLEVVEPPRSSRRPTAVAPAFWSAVTRSSAAADNRGTLPEQRLSDRPIPLVRVVPEGAREMATTVGAARNGAPTTLPGAGPSRFSEGDGDSVAMEGPRTAPGLGAERAPRTVHGVAPEDRQRVQRSPVVVPPRASYDIAVRHPSEPVIALTRSKAPTPAARPAPPPAPVAPARTQGSTTQPMASPAPGPAPKPRSSETPPDEPRRTLEALDRATTAHEVTVQLAQGLSHVANRVVIFATRASTFNARVSAGAVDASKVVSVRISAESPSVLKAACETNQYLGPLPRTEAHTALSELLGNPEGDIAVQPIVVSGHPALVIVLSEFSSAYTATERADRLARASARALSRILRQRRR